MAEEKRRRKSANGNGGARYLADKGLWEWRQTASDGIRYSSCAKLQIEAKKKCLAKIRLAEQGIDVKAAEQTLAQYLDWWLTDFIAPKRSPKTLKGYRDTVRLHITPELGKHKLNKLTTQIVTTFLRKKEREKKYSPQQIEAMLREQEPAITPEMRQAYRQRLEQEARLSPRSVAMIREVLRSALNTAVRMQMIERNPAALAEGPRQVKPERRMLTVEEARALLEAVKADRLAALYRLAISLGMRQSEIIGLRWQDVDLEAGTLRVRQTLQRIGKEIVVKEPKTERSRRTLALSPTLVKALIAHKDAQAFERKKGGLYWQDSGFVFTSATGTALDARNLVREFKRHLKAAGLPEETRFYDLRHAAASLLIAEGLPIPAVSAMLGHALTSTTLNVYAHVLPGSERLTADAMERLLG